MTAIRAIELVVGLEIHVELATRSKMFSRAPNAAHHGSNRGNNEVAPNTLIDPLVLGLPGSLPVMNRAAVEMAMLVGLALGAEVPDRCRWDRKSYFYPDMPKNYQISQYQMPLCIGGNMELPPLNERGEPEYGKTMSPGRTIRITRAHLEEDAGKLLHEAPFNSMNPDGVRQPHQGSIVDLNRAGTPLLEIVTEPDFRAAGEVVVFAQQLRWLLLWLGVSDCIMQDGQLRFEPNINTVLTLENGQTVRTPIVEVKNLNSIRSLRGAVEYEAAEQPRRWQDDGVESGPGTKRTFGWDDARLVTLPRREKEDAHDYRYFPDPDLPELRIDTAMRSRLAASLTERPDAAVRRFVSSFGLTVKEAIALVQEPADRRLFEAAMVEATSRGVDGTKAARLVANLMLQSGFKRVNESTNQDEPKRVSDLGITAMQLGELAALRNAARVTAGGADELFGLLCEMQGRVAPVEELARERGLLIVVDASALDTWCDRAMMEHPQVVADVRAGKLAALGRLVGAVMKLSAESGGGATDGNTVRARLLDRIGGSASQ